MEGPIWQVLVRKVANDVAELFGNRQGVGQNMTLRKTFDRGAYIAEQDAAGTVAIQYCINQV